MDNLLHEIQQVQKHQLDRNIEFQAERTIRRFIAESKPFLLQDLYSLTENRILENKAGDDIELLKMMLIILKRQVEID